MATKRKIQIKNKRKTYKKKNHKRDKRRKRITYNRSGKFSKIRSKKYKGGGTWVDNDTLPEKDVCPICHEEFSKTPRQAIYKTDCGHLFHNNCLNEVCETNERSNAQPTCPICRRDLYSDNSDQCTDVWAFANKTLDTNDLDAKNLALYEGKPTMKIPK